MTGVVKVNQFTGDFCSHTRKKKLLVNWHQEPYVNNIEAVEAGKKVCSVICHNPSPSQILKD